MRTSQSFRRNGSSSGRAETVVLFSVGSFVFAIPARSLEEIREIGGLRDFSSRLAKVKQTLDRQERTYFVVDAARHFRVANQRPGRLMILRHAPVAVTVEAIDRMQEIHAIHELPDAFAGEERNWYRGLALIKGKIVPVVRAESFLTKSEVILLSTSVQKRAAKAEAVTA